MGWTRFIFCFPDTLDIATAQAEHIRTGFIVPLPFRLRLGRLFSTQCDEAFDIVFRNRLDIPPGTTADEIHKLMWIDKRIRPRQDFFTEALIIDRNPGIEAHKASELVAYARGQAAAMPKYRERFFEALSALNDSIVAYHHATNTLFGGTVLRRLTNTDFFEHLRYVHTIFCPATYELAEKEVLEILDARAKRELIPLEKGQFALDLDDIPEERVFAFTSYLQLHRRYLFYQFALDAKSRMVDQDFVSAILFAVVALEGVHAVVLQKCLEDRLRSSTPDPSERAKKAEEKANKFLLEVGLSEMIEMTALFFLDDADKPSQEEVRLGKLGITIRNEVMHALAKKGQYKLRNRTNRQISDAYKSVLNLFRHFANIIERDGDDAAVNGE